MLYNYISIENSSYGLNFVKIRAKYEHFFSKNASEIRAKFVAFKKNTNVVEKSTSSKSFIVRSASTWNHLPPQIRNLQSLKTFKDELKKWTRENIKME